MLALYFNPTGRINRSTWWLNTIILTVGRYASLFLMAYILAASFGGSELDQWLGVIAAFALIALVVVAFWCWMALNIKRLHDRDHSASWMLWYLVPFVGAWVMLVTLGFLPGTYGSNRYGDMPM